MVSLPDVSVCRFSGAHGSETVVLPVAGDVPDDELELPQPAATSANAAKATARSFLTMGGTPLSTRRGEARTLPRTGARAARSRHPSDGLPHPAGQREMFAMGVL